MTITRRNITMTLALAVALAAPVGAKPRNAAPHKAAPHNAAPAPSALEPIGRSFESARLLEGADRIAALEQVGTSVNEALRGDLDANRRAAAYALAGTIRSALGDFRGAITHFERAGKEGPFADDAAFAAIEALEASGDDAAAAREWLQWEKKYPQSSLLPAARLAQAWNALRRGDVAASRKLLDGLAHTHPWIEKDPRGALARAVAFQIEGKSTEALAALGPSPQGAPALYLRALALQSQGVMLRAAAGFQSVAERYPGSPLADHARLAKANVFLAAAEYRSAAEEFARVGTIVTDPTVRAEAELRRAGAVFLAGSTDSALKLLRGVVERHAGTDVAARAQFLVGEALVARGQHADAIIELNRVLTSYFQHKVAASAQYRVARCLDLLGRTRDASGSYQAVVSGYPLEPEAPAAAYLAGVGMLRENKPLAAAPYFQIVLDRYAVSHDPAGHIVFATPGHQELVEASLCMLEYSYHRAGNLGMLSGAPHLLLQKMPASRSTWRAWALLIDADAAAAMARYPEAQATLEILNRDFPDHPVGAAATKLLAWTYSRQGRDSLAIATEERLLARWGRSGNDEIVSAAFLDIAHERFNQKRYREAAGAYEDFLRRFPGHPRRLMALYQAGLCYLRLDRAGDAVDRWEAIMRDSAATPLAERAWARAGDVYFQASRYGEARRCYQGLLKNFGNSSAAGLATLRLAQCEYNAGNDAAALEAFSNTIAQYPGTPVAREAQRGTELSLYRLSQKPDGAKVLARLVEQFPGSSFAADAQFQIAKRAYQEKRWNEAADGFRRVVSQFPSYSGADQAQFLLADAQAQAKDPAAAILAYQQFLSFFPQSDLASTVSFRLGLLHFEAKDHMDAGVAFSRALEDTGASREVRSAARYNLALCQRLLGRPEEARSELERYRAEFGDDARAAEIAFQTGDLEEAAGRISEAAAEFDKALNHPHSAELGVEILFRLGRCREQLGDIDGALRAYVQASKAGDRDQPFRLSAVARLASLYESKRDYPRALTAYRDIVRNARDQELVAAAADRVAQLESGSGK